MLLFTHHGATVVDVLRFDGLHGEGILPGLRRSVRLLCGPIRCLVTFQRLMLAYSELTLGSTLNPLLPGPLNPEAGFLFDRLPLGTLCCSSRRQVPLPNKHFPLGSTTSQLYRHTDLPGPLD